jgi:hypothetical protein
MTIQLQEVIRILIKGLYLERKPPAGNAYKHVLTKGEFLIGILVAIGVTEGEPLICPEPEMCLYLKINK